MLNENLDMLIAMLEDSLSTKGRRHLVGGIFLSMSLLFGGLAFTVMTTKTEGNE